MAEYKKTMLEYLDFLENGEAEKLLSLFSDEAIVHSPLYGDLPAGTFYRDLFEATENSDIKLRDCYNGDRENCAAINFEYSWTLINGERLTFNCVDLFEFDSSGKILELFIIYDTYPIRERFQKARKKHV
jgi:hypothetical protein